MSDRASEAPRDPYLLVFGLYFFSGAAGLIYELIWSRLLALTFGHTAQAAAVVLAAFMGGLALGSWLLSPLADRSKRPLQLFGLLEIATGLYCLAAPWLLQGVRAVNLAIGPDHHSGDTHAALIRFILAFGVLVIPTTLMGGALPAIARTLLWDQRATGLRLGVLYGTNLFGGILGAFLTGYLLLPTIGTTATNYLGAGLSFLAGGGALLLASRLGDLPIFDSPPLLATEKKKKKDKNKKRKKKPAGPLPPLTSAETTLVFLTLLACGGLSMTYQIIWMRALALVIGNSTYAFSAILVAVLLGLGLGSFLYSHLGWPLRPAQLGTLQLGIALGAFFLLAFFGMLPTFFLTLYRGYSGPYVYIQVSQFLAVAVIVLAPATLLGMVTPSITIMVTASGRSFGRWVGRCYSISSVGAVIGSLATAFLFIPLLGAQRSLALGVGLNLLLGGALYWVSRPTSRAWVGLGTALALGLLLLMPGWHHRLMTAGVGIYPYVYTSGGMVPGESTFTMAYFREGADATVAVADYGKGFRILLVNGKGDASTAPEDMETQVKLATLPMALHGEAHSVAVIGLGSGITLGTASRFPEVTHLDAMELEEAVVEAAGLFSDVNFGVLEDERLRILIDDARSIFATTTERYDVISSEPPNPWVSGVADLFTVEFFREAREHLEAGGVFCQWIQGYLITSEEVRLISRTMLEVFPEATLWRAGGDFLLIGREDPSRRRSLAKITRDLRAHPEFAPLFRGWHASISAEDFLADYLLGPGELATYAGPGPVNTDDFNRLEFDAPRILYRTETPNVLPEILGHKKSLAPPFIDLPDEGPGVLGHRIARVLDSRKILPLATWHRRHARQGGP